MDFRRWAPLVAGGLVLGLVACGGDGTDPGPDPRVPGPTGRDAAFTSRVLVTGLANPWEITWGPDGRLWVTERTAGRVTGVSVPGGETETLLTLPDLLATDGTQDGLLGLAPADPFVYLAYTYDAAAGAADPDRRAKIVRYTYDPSAGRLVDPEVVLAGLPASVDHNSGRLLLGPDGKLYYSIGDQGNNQFTRYCSPIQAQRLPTAEEVAARDWTAYQGKILRLNVDGSIPADNPRLGGVRSHVYSYGHRNAQGLVFGPGDRLYATEHGPKSDDEVNLIRAGGNYGWPRVAGFADGQAYEYANWSAAKDPPCQALSYNDFDLPPAVPRQREARFDDPAFVPPLRTFFTVPSDFDFTDERCGGRHFLCWPTIAPSSLDVYTDPDGVPDWADSLLIPSLKNGTVYRVPLRAGGAALDEAVGLFRTVNRYRDLASDPDGVTLYVATDAGGWAREASGEPTARLADPGAILEFRYSG